MAFFNFGNNWRAFSERRLDEHRVDAAAASLRRLLPDSLRGRSFLDVGCGTGLFAIAAAKLGAGPVVGIDVNPLCVSVSQTNLRRLAPESPIAFRLASALDKETLVQLGLFDVVYAWGSLHHTGAMWKAIDLVAGRVPVGGTLVLRHLCETHHLANVEGHQAGIQCLAVFGAASYRVVLRRNDLYRQISGDET